MTDREMLMLCAKACGNNAKLNPADGKHYVLHGHEWVLWAPNADDGDCARMCALLMLDSVYQGDSVIVARNPWETAMELYADHNNNRLAAWRCACCRVAAEIGRG